jgi:histidinol-phosphate aminotransferase
MSPLELVRDDLRAFAGYASARRSALEGSIWLNANESPWRNPADPVGVQRYPEPQPAALRAALAALYGVSEAQLLLGRGSDEAIDLLVRALCRPGRDGVLVTPPVFGMYAVCARLQGAPCVEVPLRDDGERFALDLGEVARVARAGDCRLVFLCSPSNPTGGALDPDAVLRLARELEGRALVVVDEAYIEYSDAASLAGAVATQPNLAVLRTLSKAHALAAARIGTLIAAPELIGVLRNCQAPYPLPTPCVQLALAALQPAVLAETRARVARVVAGRERLRLGLAATPGVRRVYASQGNYLLARFDDADAALARLLAAGVVVRDMRAAPQLGDALRITAGAAEENDAVLAALAAGVPVRERCA